MDVAKGKSMACLVSDEGEILMGPKEFSHHTKGLEELFLAAESISGDYAVIMEATGIYHKPPEGFFKSKGKDVIVANPLLTSMARATLRKTKTDKTDSEMLAASYFNRMYSDSASPDALQSQSRLIELLTEQRSKLKVLIRERCHICFPSLEESLDSDAFFRAGTMRLLASCPHPAKVRRRRAETIASLLAGGKEEAYRCMRLAERILGAARSDFAPSVGEDSLVCHALSFLATDYARLEDDIERESAVLEQRAREKFPFDVWRTFPGIGERLAAYLTVELGDLTRFENEKKLTAYCGLDPTIVQSGRTIDYHGPISKRGNSHARLHLFQAVLSILRSDGCLGEESDITAYYRKKRAEGKHHYEAVTACSTKLLRKMYFRSKDSKRDQAAAPAAL